MNPGKLNKRIVIKRFKEITDGAGGFINDKDIHGPAWEKVCETWANITPVSAREFVQAASLQVALTHKIAIRYRDDIDRAMIVVYNGKRLNIQHVINVKEQNRFLEMMCVSYD